MANQLWCAECGIKGEPTPAIGVFDGDPLCAAHARAAGAVVPDLESRLSVNAVTAERMPQQHDRDAATAPAVDVNKKENAMKAEGRKLCSVCNQQPLRADNKTGVCTPCQESGGAKPKAERKAKATPQPKTRYVEMIRAESAKRANTVDIPQIPITALDNWWMKLPAGEKAATFSRWLQGA